MKRINMKYIAEKAGVSISTVSLVLNERPGVKRETRRRVLEIARKYHYIPNHIARSLVTRKTSTVGIIVPDISEVFYGTLVKIMQDALDRSGYSMMLCNAENNQHKERYYISFLVEKGTDGIIMVPCSGANADLIQAISTPVVFVDRCIPELQKSYVGIDNRKAAREATEHLIRLGHRKIACLAGPPEASINEERITGYREALEAHGLSVDPGGILPTDLTVQGGYDATMLLLSLESVPTAVFTSGDTCAIGVYEALAEKSILVPEEMAIVGFDDMKFAPFLRVPLTSVHQPLEHMGQTAVELLLKTLREGAVQPQRIIMDAPLIVRESCGYGLGRRSPEKTT
jgi:LacI family transcriptional regulator